MKKIKILFFIPFFTYGGAEKVTLLLANRLPAKKMPKAANLIDLIKLLIGKDNMIYSHGY